MDKKAGLLIVVALAVAALFTWQLALRRPAMPDRAGPERAGREAPPEPPGIVPPEAPGEAGMPAPTAEGEPLPTEGVRIRVLAEGHLLRDAHVYAAVGRDTCETRAEGGGTWLVGVTGDVVVGAAHARYGPVRRKVRAEAGKITEVTLELPRGETLDVLVVADRGDAPVAGASVYVLRAGEKDLDGGNGGLEEMFSDDGSDIDLSILGTLDLGDFGLLGGAPAVAIPRLSTDADGRVRVEGLPPGTVDVVVSHPEFVPTRLRNKPVGKEAVARLSGGGSLTVLAPYVDGRAAEGHLCGAVRPGLLLSMPVDSAKVDAEGKAFFPHLPPGPLKIVVAKVNHPLALMGLAMGGVVVERSSEEKGPGEEEESSPKQIAAGNVTIRGGEHATLDLREAKGARIEGVVVGEGEGAAVVLVCGDTQVGTRMTDAQGRFAFDSAAPGRYGLTAAGDSGGLARAECEVKEGDAVVTVRLEFPKGGILGRVLGADGKPAGGARVLVAPRERPSGQAANLMELMEQLAGFAEADAEGAFRVTGVAPGEYRVLAAVGRRLDAAIVTVREGAEAAVELRVDDARVRRLVVRLEDADRKPVEGTVIVLGADGGSAEVLALADDEEIESGGTPAATHEFFLAPGRYRLVARAPGLAPALGHAVEMAGDRDLTLALGPGVRVELSLEGPDGPLASRDVDVRNDGGIRLGGHSPLEMLLGGAVLRTDGQGILSLDAVPPGRYALLLDGRERGRFEVGAMPVAKRIRVE